MTFANYQMLESFVAPGGRECELISDRIIFRQ